VLPTLAWLFEYFFRKREKEEFWKEALWCTGIVSLLTLTKSMFLVVFVWWRDLSEFHVQEDRNYSLLDKKLTMTTLWRKLRSITPYRRFRHWTKSHHLLGYNAMAIVVILCAISVFVVCTCIQTLFLLKCPCLKNRVCTVPNRCNASMHSGQMWLMNKQPSCNFLESFCIHVF